MSEEPQGTGAASPSRIVALDDATAAHRRIAEERFETLQKRYDRRAKWHHRHFRISGILVIIISSTLPLLAGWHYPGKDVTIALAGVVIAAATGLRTFYQWDQMWALFRRSHSELIHAFNNWAIDIVQAEVLDDPKRREKLAREATRAFLEKTEMIRIAESNRFFSALTFPESITGGLAFRIRSQLAVDVPPDAAR